MADRPLLLFPTPETAGRSKKHGYPSSIHKPSRRRQGQRLSPIFNQLQTAFDSRRVELQQTAAGADPEQVLVIETVGSIENFANAVKRIDGFEWMGEVDTDQISPDDDFYHEGDETKELSGRLYMIMTNHQALIQMLSLWRRYQNDKDMVFAHGTTKFRDVFLCLKDIRSWGVQDRIEETGILDVWQEELQIEDNRVIRFEVELWFRGNDDRQQEARDQVDHFIEQLGGTVLNDCFIREIAYHALLAEIPANVAQQITEHHEVDLIKCDSVMFFRPVGQMATVKRPDDGELSDYVREGAALPVGEPIVAILDGLPLTNHYLLEDRLIIDDPDDYASAYTGPDRTHGTAMASLVVHGDLNDLDPPLSRPVYVRPIMKPVPSIASPHREQIPEDVLVVDHIHRAIHRMFESEGIGEASAPSIRIVNFSIGDPYRQFSQSMSPLARLLDWLSVKYRIIFVVSAGNHLQGITLDLSKSNFDALPENVKETEVVMSIYRDARHRKILSPAESINSITVGGLHHDSSTAAPVNHLVDLFVSILPSPVSAFGSGHRRSIKPDLLFNSGRVLYREPIGIAMDTTFDPMDLKIAPGNKVASPSPLAGELNKAVYCCGSSNAGALVSRMGAACHDTLIDVFEDQAPEIELNSYITPLLKAMIVHGCSWGEIGSRLEAILQTQENGQQIKNSISRWLGYGVPDGERVLACTEQRATLLGFGQLIDGEAHHFNLPLPASLGARRDWRRLSISLAWMSPIASRTQSYRAASLWFEIDKEILKLKRQDADYYAVQRGTIQHEVFEGEGAVAITDDANLLLKVNCRKDAAKILEPVPYGLAVSLEVSEGIDIAIYDEIRTRVLTAIEIRAREDR